MTKDEIVKMARECKLHLPIWNEEQDPKRDDPQWVMVSPTSVLLEKFAALCRADLETKVSALVAEVERLKAVIDGKQDLWKLGHLMHEAWLQSDLKQKAHELTTAVTVMEQVIARNEALTTELADWKARALKAEQAGEHREDYPASASVLGVEIAKAKEDERLYGVGFCVNGWHVPAALVSCWGISRKSAQQQPSAVAQELTDEQLERQFCEIVGLESINPKAADTRRACLWFTKGYRYATPPQPAAQEPTSAVPVVEQLMGALREIEWSNDTKWQADRASAALAAGQKYLKENGK